MMRKMLIVAGALAVLTAPGIVRACLTNADCTNGEVCVAAICQPCALDAECADADFCNGTEICVSGACQSGPPPTCDDSNSCTTDTCDSLLGCQHMPVSDGASCSDGDACNGPETCL